MATNDYALQHVVDVAMASTQPESVARPRPEPPLLLPSRLIHPTWRSSPSMSPDPNVGPSPEELDARKLHSSRASCLRPPLPLPPVIISPEEAALEARKPANFSAMPPAVPAFPSINAGTHMRDPFQVLMESGFRSEQPTRNVKAGSAASAGNSFGVLPSDWESCSWPDIIACLAMPDSDLLQLPHDVSESMANSTTGLLPERQLFQTEEQQLSVSASEGSPGSPGPSLGMSPPVSSASEAAKSRLRWTSELHDKFVAAIIQLGGPNRATPKSVLRLMKCNDITIYHVKSHLQKFRLVPDTHISNAAPRSERKRPVERKRRLQATSAPSSDKISQALHEQMQLQKSLHEQLETQKQLQSRIEEQGASLQRMIAAQLKAGQVFGVSSEQIANCEFLALAGNSNWAAAPASTSTLSSSADPTDPSPKRTRVEVPHLVIVPNVMYYNPVHNCPSLVSLVPNPATAAANTAAVDQGTTESTPPSSSQPVTTAAPRGMNHPQGGCIPKNGGAKSCCMTCIYADLSLA